MRDQQILAPVPRLWLRFQAFVKDGLFLLGDLRLGAHILIVAEFPGACNLFPLSESLYDHGRTTIQVRPL